MERVHKDDVSPLAVHLIHENKEAALQDKSALQPISLIVKHVLLQLNAPIQLPVLIIVNALADFVHKDNVPDVLLQQ